MQHNEHPEKCLSMNDKQIHNPPISEPKQYNVVGAQKNKTHV